MYFNGGFINKLHKSPFPIFKKTTEGTHFLSPLPRCGKGLGEGLNSEAPHPALCATFSCLREKEKILKFKTHK
jgi:hypothetical protein